MVSQNTRETRLFVHLLRQAGSLAVVGALVEAVTLVIRQGGLTNALVGTAGVAIALRVMGAVALVAHTNSIVLVVDRRPVVAANVRTRANARSGALSAAITGFEKVPVAQQRSVARAGEVNARIQTSAWWFAGLIAMSYAFDGHTVTKGNRLVTAVLAVLHVLGGGIWLGGLICVALLSRHRSGNRKDLEFITTVGRFSVVASVAVTAVGVAGLILAVTILDSVSELWTTAWGRILIAKSLIVVLAAAAGAFNHFVLVPEMAAVSAYSDERQSFVRMILIELVAIGAALALTAFLVVAAS
jgi:copper transport protein